ncbi:hypothetical protein [Phenylobacterium sp.]|uniref:hypothetical protein n=1 Tax=Phenylobacterium sp. TaxID=1871053 RepID=UPI003BAA1E09
MTDDADFNAALDPTFFDGRLLIEITAWDWNLRVAISRAPTRSRSQPLKGLDYGRDFTVRGRIRAPHALRGRSIKVTLSPFGPRVRFGQGGLKHVGVLTASPSGGETDYEAVLMLPESAISSTATSLASIWKYLQVLTFDEGAEGAKTSAYFFAAEIHPNLREWADAD